MTDDNFPLAVPGGYKHGFFLSVLMFNGFLRCIFGFKIES